MDFMEVAAEATKAAPPATVTGLYFMGYPLSNWVVVFTLLYVWLQIYFILRDKWWRDDGRKS